jgi:hypothetical protein
MMAGRNREGRSMSTAQLPATAELPATAHLSVEAKKQLLLLLARELLIGPTGMTLADASGEIRVFVRPPEAVGAPPVLSPERRAELAARLTETAVPVADVVADLKRQAEQLRNQQS